MTGFETDANAAGPAASDGPAPVASRLVPGDLAYLIEERPTLWYESQSEYDSLREGVFGELVPTGVIECILVKNLVDYVWEARRHRRLKVAATHAEMPSVAARMLANDSLFLRDSRPDDKTVLRLARAAAARGEARDEGSLSSLAEKEHVTAEVLHYEAHKAGAEMLHNISRECERLERRRDQLLKQIEDRRAALGTMARSLLKREAADLATVIVEA